MNGKNPFTVSRNATETKLEPFQGFPGSMNQNENTNPKRQSSFTAANRVLSQHNQIKGGGSIQKLDLEKIQSFLDDYNKASLIYRDEEFSQQADAFLMKISAEKKSKIKGVSYLHHDIFFITVPKEIKNKYPLYHILVAICKIFLMNEYEIVVFACFLDKISWKYEEYVNLDEAAQLEGFPLPGGIEVSDDGKRLIIYLLLIGFSLKQRLNDLSEFEKISAYCQKLCPKFHVIYNRWTRVSQPRFDAIEINVKWKHLCKRDGNDGLENVKDYNHIVDDIMTLTGSYSSKGKVEHPPVEYPVMNKAYTAPVHNEVIVPGDDPTMQLRDLDSDFRLSKLPSLVMEKSGVFDSRAFNDALRSLMTGNFDPTEARKKIKTEEKPSLPQIPQLSSFNSFMKNLPADDGPELQEPSLSRNQSGEGLPDMGQIGRTYSTFSFIADK